MGHVVIIKGTTSSDTECADRDNTAIIVGVTASVAFACGVIVIILWRRRKKLYKVRMIFLTMVSI